MLNYLWKNKLLFVSCMVLLTAVLLEASPSFNDTSTPEGWTLIQGQVETGTMLCAKSAVAELKITDPLSVPVEATFRFRVKVGDEFAVSVTENGTNAVSPLLRTGFRLAGLNQGYITAHSDGKPMATTTISCRTWSQVDRRDGSRAYNWRFPKIKNLWDDRDLAEIGASYDEFVPFEEKVFVFRLVLTSSSRQIWMDDRLVAEERIPTAGGLIFSIQLRRKTNVLSADFRIPEETGAFIPLSLTAYSHTRTAQEYMLSDKLSMLHGQMPIQVPMLVTDSYSADIDLGESLFRYRLTHGSGPNAGYVNALVTWPSAFDIDPAVITFRVPYRNYKNVWLLAWLDDEPNSVPAGELRFFREDAGYPARTEFEITDEAIKSGLVRKLPDKTVNGRSLYLIQVPIDADGMYGLRDLSDQFLDFELIKPARLTRSYPDPIYYGYHPAGSPSAIHVAGITLEEAPFGIEVVPACVGHIFERPQKPSYIINVTNTTGNQLDANISLGTKSYDGTERGGASGQVVVPPFATETVPLTFELHRLGWHEVRVDVDAGGTKRGATLSLVVLPPNTRTYGYDVNETRFGTWNLLGHYVPLQVNPNSPENEAVLAMFRKLGLRRISLHESFFNADMLKRQDFLPNGPHTVGKSFRNTVRADGTVDDTEMSKAVSSEVAHIQKDFVASSYFYGGEWHIGKEVQYSPWQRYTGDGDRGLTAEEKTNADRHVKIFSAIGREIRKQSPGTKLVLQWGAPIGTIAYMRAGMPKDLVDFFGMDAPMFELLPEISNVTGSVNQLWSLRQEAKELGWQYLPISWCEGPFFPTNPGALTEKEQEEYQIRYWLLGLAYGIEQFQAGVVPYDAGNYYGAEHYGAGIFHRRPSGNPKPAVAAVATATSMLCGADVVGPVKTGVLTTYCMAFQKAKDKTMIYALWRVNGTVDAEIKVTGDKPIIIDAMGNEIPCQIKDKVITVKISSSPVWLTGAGKIDGFTFSAPTYVETPAEVTRPLVAMTADQWTYDNTEDHAYAYNHFAIRRITDANLKAEFGQGEDGYADAVAITFPVEPQDRPLATRYGQLKLKKPVSIPGRASALGIWIKGNSSWGRVVYQCRDAKEEIWTSVGTKDDWNCDDDHGWSYVSFEGWRYVRFPLPGNHPWDSSRDLETTWWGNRGGDGIVDLPLTLEKIIVEARNEVPYLGEMTLVPERSYKLSGLIAEYDSEEDATDRHVAENKIRMVLPEWTGPTENPIAKLLAEGTGTPPVIREFAEPSHFNDGRQMVIHFDQNPALTYNLYLGRFIDGRGAELLVRGVKDQQTVTGLRPEIKTYMFLTAVNADKKESQPSEAFELITHDNFAEK